MQPIPTLMPIGRFASACRLSVKALRHYDEQGILKPAHVDNDTGYRYYRPEQARDAVLIGMLRSLDLPLPIVHRLLRADRDERQQLLDEARERMALELARRQQALHSIERIARVGELMPYEIGVRVEPAHRVARLTIVTTAERMVQASYDAMYRLLDTLNAAGYPPRDPVMCINEDPDGEGHIEVHCCAGLDAGIDGGDGFEVAEIPGGPVVWLTHDGAYEELGIAYHALAAWAQERGLQQRDALREVYLNDPALVPVQELQTEVMLPVRRNIDPV